MEKLESGHFYHIYNRGNNKQDVFFEPDNYDYFLKLLNRHIKPISKVFAYCLLPNHFHLVLRINNNIDKPSQALSNLMNAYTKAINKRYNRTGSLFQKPFKRIKIENEDYLTNLILYVNLNTEKHGLDDYFENYLYSSYKEILTDKPKIIAQEDVINLFENKENFIATHQLKKHYLKNKELSLE
jgi:REP element-mobilizing transposase RayT